MTEEIRRAALREFRDHAIAYARGARFADLTAAFAAYRRSAGEDDGAAADAAEAAALAGLHALVRTGRPGSPEHTALRQVLYPTGEGERGAERAIALAQRAAGPVRALAAAFGTAPPPLPGAWLEEMAQVFLAEPGTEGTAVAASAALLFVGHPRTPAAGPGALAAEGTVLLDRYLTLGHRSDLGRALTALDSAFALLPDGLRADWPYLTAAGRAHLLAARSGDTEHLPTAFRLLGAAVARTPGEVSPALVAWAESVHRLLETTDSQYDAKLVRDRAFPVLEAVLRVGADGDAAAALNTSLARGLLALYRLDGDRADLEAARGHAAPAAAGGSAAALLVLGDCTRLLGLLDRDPARLDEAVALFDRLAAVGVFSTIDVPGGPGGLGVPGPTAALRAAETLEDRHELTGDPADLAAALERIEALLTTHSRYGPTGRVLAGAKAAVLAARHRWYGDPGDFEAAVELSERADPDGREWLLARLFLDRHHRTGSPFDLERTVDLLRRAVPDGTPPPLLLSAFLLALHRRLGDPEELAEALRILRADHVRTSGGSHPGGAICGALAEALLTHVDTTGDDTLLGAALACARANHAWSGAPTAAIVLARALTLAAAGPAATSGPGPDSRAVAPDDPEGLLRQVLARPLAPATRAAALAAYADLLDRAGASVATDSATPAGTGSGPTGGTGPATSAGCLDEARTLLRPGTAERDLIDLRLAELLAERHRRLGHDEDLRRAVELAAGVVDGRVLPPPARLRAAVLHARLRSGQGAADLAAALAAFRVAVDLVDESVGSQFTDTERRHRASDLSMLGSDAAACALAAGRVEEAVELLEQARFVAWGPMVRANADLLELRRVDPTLAARLGRLRTRLARALTVRPTDQDRRWREREERSGDRASERAGIRAELAELEAEAGRALGRPAFAAGPGLDRLRAATLGGTAVLVNVADTRSDAVLVDTDRVRALHLPSLRRADAEEHGRRWEEAAYAFARGRGLTRLRAENTMREVLAWLWDTVGEPVTAEVCREVEPWPRVWWCPTGPLTLLPLHAAGRGADAVLERVVSSYTVTLGHLWLARTREDAAPAGRPLVATVSELPEQPGTAPLGGPARDAADLAARIVPPPVRLDGREVTRDRVLLALAEQSAVHLACHGIRRGDALDSGLLLPDGVLTFQDIVTEQAAAPFVFLAACHTAIGDLHQADEGIHLAAALQLAGVRQVVASLWQTVDDDLMGTAVRLIYDGLVVDGTLRPDRAARAVHEALRTLRAQNPDRPMLWAPYVHFGD
ncbi:CHAT domain-containing protein [Kitasatospora sp. NPDC089913]|uniref:CHAT domain-containing protein n=1 Tax=Kitasatospora sp. NPDC089913 TaxID=3364080 RepID=UPI0037FF8FE3